MVRSTAEVTVNRGERIKTGKRQEVERERGAKQDKGGVKWQEGNEYIFKRLESGS